jgi:hypothetical protein
MPHTSSEIISDRFRLARWLGVVALLWGTAAALYYSNAGLALTHYDAKAHLVVARRVIDSITPGWQQLGAVWLPLPHLLNLLPVQVDLFYRTGASATAISMASFAALVWAAARIVLRLSGSATGAVLAAALIALNPNVLYLQSTPMTEPLLLALTTVAVMLAIDALDGGPSPRWRAAGWALAAACLTRYEAWPVATSLVLMIPLARWRQGVALRRGAREAVTLAAYPAVAIVLFLVHSKVTIGEWFVTGGFYVPDPLLRHRPIAVAGAVWWGARQLGSELLMRAGLVAALFLLWQWARRRDQALLVLPFALVASAALPAYAFFQGHPLRIRYMVPLVTATAIVTAVGVGRMRRGAALASVAILGAVLAQTRPFDRNASMVQEAQWDVPRSLARRAITACLPPPGRGDTVMASMGSLAHYMQELSAHGFALRDFLHEGNGDIWLAAYAGPQRYVNWILMDEESEGGDMLAARAREDPRFLKGYTRACTGAGLALYRRK